MSASTGIQEQLPGLQTWLDADPVPVAWVTADGSFRVANRRFLTALGLAAEGVLGRRRAEVLASLRLAGDDSAARELLLTDRVPPDGLQVAVHAVDTWIYHSLPVQSDAGELLGWRDWLEPQAGLGAARSDEQLLARIGHELRTPMTSVLGFCHMLLEYGGPLNEQQTGFVHRILRNATILLQLLNNLLDAAKMHEGRAAPCLELVDPETLVADAVGTIEPQTFERELQVEVHVDPNLPDFYTDRLKLKQILINLLANAVNYTDHGRIALDARLDDGWAVFTVSDTGIGIPADAFERIFEPYVQVRNGNRAPASPSSGLGLTVARGLAELLGGTLQVESQLGVGSTFTLRLALVLSLAEEPRPAES